MPPDDGGPSQPARAADRASGRPGGRWPWIALVIAVTLPLAMNLVCFFRQVPLGVPGRLVYPYSPRPLWRLEAVPSLLPVAVVLAAGVWYTASERGGRRRAGLALAAFGLASAGVWSYTAPPDHLKQHIFNMLSPSHDGAFVREALGVRDWREYLRIFPHRARTPPAQMRGTRVVSNPPATTLLVYALRPAVTTLGPDEHAFREELGEDLSHHAEFVEQARLALTFARVVTVLWLLAAVPLYAAARRFLPPAPAAALAVCAVLSPMTLLFTPGKDPAQLLTVALPLWLWVVAQRRGPWWAAAAGAVGVLACMVSLAHVWAALAVLAADVLTAAHRRGELATLWRRGILPALGGGGAAAVGLALLCHANVPATASAVAAAQAEVTRGPDAMPLLQQARGIPLFLLFAGPALWALAAWRLGSGRPPRNSPARDDHARFGRYLLLVTALFMVATVGYTNVETPRLWIPFVPLLLLGGMLQFDQLRRPSRPVSVLLAVLVGLHVVASAAQWTLMDARESELRLITRQFFN